MNNNIPEENEHEELRKFIIIILLVLASLGLYWMVEAILQLWNSPKSVKFVSMFIELMRENEEPIMKTHEGAEINLPQTWPVIIGVFLSIVLISSIGILVRSFLLNALSLLFPKSYAMKKGSVATVIEQLTNKKTKS